MNALKPNMCEIGDRRLLTFKEAAAYANVGVSTIRKWAREQNAVRAFGRSRRVDRKILDAFLDKEE